MADAVDASDAVFRRTAKGHTNHLIGPHRALTELNGPHRKWNKQMENFRITHAHVKIIEQQITHSHMKTYRNNVIIISIRDNFQITV